MKVFSHNIHFAKSIFRIADITTINNIILIKFNKVVFHSRRMHSAEKNALLVVEKKLRD